MWKKVLLTGVCVLEVLCIAVLVAHTVKGKRYIVSTTPILKSYLNFDSIDSPGFYRLEPTVMRWYNPWLHTEVTYAINGHGLNMGRDVAYEKPHGVTRIAILGDSHTFGLFVPVSDNYASRLEVLANTPPCTATEVLNFGVPGYDAYEAMQFFSREGTRYDPDVVIWFLKHDDLTQLPPQAFNALVPKEEVDAFNRRGWGGLRDELSTYLGGRSKVDALTRSIEREAMRQLFKIYNGPLVILTDSSLDEQDREEISELVRERPNTFRVSVRLDKSMKLPDMHPSTDGHAFIASTLFETLRTHNLISCEASR